MIRSYVSLAWRLLRSAAFLLVTLGMLAALIPGMVAAKTTAKPAEPDVLALSPANELLRFNEARPDRILSKVAIMGLQQNENLLGIDFRPANKQLYGVSNQSRLYLINPESGAAMAVGMPFVLPLNFDKAIGIDFNPVPDRLRIVTDKGQNLRINPDTGAVVDGNPQQAGIQPDGQLNYLKGDRNEGTAPRIVGAAYINNVAGAQTTTLYDIDAGLDTLAIQNPPNDGSLQTVGSLRVKTTEMVGFDIFTDQDGDNARAALQREGQHVSRFFTIDLSSGKAKMKDKGTIGGDKGVLVRDIAIDIR